MNFESNLQKYSVKIMIKPLFLSLITVLAMTISTQAQSLNDDLTPKTNPESKSRPAKTYKKTTLRKTYKRTGAVKPTIPQNPPPSGGMINNSESSNQIIARFMNFQQTGGVTPKDWESVLRQSTQTLQGNPNDVNAKAQMLIAQGELAYNRGDYSNALIHFNGASQILSNSSLPPYGIGKVYLATKQPAEAESSFERALKLNKSFALAYKGAGDALTAQGKAKKAQEYYENAAKLGLASGNVMRPSIPQNNQRNIVPTTTTNARMGQPDASSAYQAELRNARALTAKKKWQDSLNKLLPLAQSNPNADIYIAIGENYVGLEQMLSAQQAFRKATELNPNSALAFYKTGTVLLEMNEFKSAAESFEKSLILDQRGTTINRREARKMADKANERVKNPNGGKKRFLII